MKVGFHGSGIEQIAGVAAVTAFLRVETSREEPDDGDNYRLDLFANGAVIVRAGTQLLAHVLDDLVYDWVDFGPLYRSSVLEGLFDEVERRGCGNAG